MMNGPRQRHVLGGALMDYLDLTLPTPEENLALDEALLLDAEAGGGEVLRVWELPGWAVVLGSAGRLAEDVDEAACAADRVPVLRRTSGGGTVLLGPGCLAYTLVLAYERDPRLRDVTLSYQVILDRVRRALGGLTPAVVHEGSSDLAWGDRKVSGNSQRRRQTHLLHHGTLLYAFDLARIPRYLRVPNRQPLYRRQRAHEAFVANLPLSAAALKARRGRRRRSGRAGRRR
jgi:lipoate-protein ligase A